MNRIACWPPFFPCYFTFLVAFYLLQIENNWNTWHVRNQFDYSGTYQTVKVGLAEQPYVLCQILFVTQTQLNTQTNTLTLIYPYLKMIDSLLLNMNIHCFMRFSFNVRHTWNGILMTLSRLLFTQL